MQIEALTRKSSLLAMLLLLLLVVATLLRSRLTPFEVEVATSPYFERVISYILAALSILGGALVAGRNFLQSGLNRGFSTLSIPIYGVLLCGIFVTPNILEYSLTSLCFASALLLLTRSLNNPEERDSLFFGSMLLGVVPLLTPQGALLVAILPAITLLFALQLRQIILIIVGYLLPLVALSYVVWFGGGELLGVAESLWQHLVTPRTLNLETIPFVGCAMVLYIVALLLGGAIYGVVKPDSMFLLSRARRSLILNIFILALGVAILLLPSAELSSLAFVALPVTMLLSLVLSLLPRTASTIAYWLLLALTVLHLFVA